MWYFRRREELEGRFLRWTKNCMYVLFLQLETWNSSNCFTKKASVVRAYISYLQEDCAVPQKMCENLYASKNVVSKIKAFFI